VLPNIFLNKYIPALLLNYFEEIVIIFSLNFC